MNVPRTDVVWLFLKTHTPNDKTSSAYKDLEWAAAARLSAYLPEWLQPSPQFQERRRTEVPTVNIFLNRPVGALASPRKNLF